MTNYGIARAALTYTTISLLANANSIRMYINIKIGQHIEALEYLLTIEFVNSQDPSRTLFYNFFIIFYFS